MNDNDNVECWLAVRDDFRNWIVAAVSLGSRRR